MALLQVSSRRKTIFNTQYNSIRYFSVCHPVQKSLDLLFLLDGSGSVGGSTFDVQKSMVQRIIEQIDISSNKTQVAILQYSSYTKEEFPFDRYQVLRTVECCAF